MEKKSIASPRGWVWYWIRRHPGPHAGCIVFTHGLTANHSMFPHQVGHFSQTHTVITWDVPLHGDSVPYRDFSYDHAAEDLLAILDAEDIEKAVLVGMSMGGFVCQPFAAAWPQRTQAFIALDTTPFGTRYYSKGDLFWLRHVEAMSKWFPDGMLRSSIAKANALSEEGRRLMLEMLRSLSKGDIARLMGIAYGSMIKENRDLDITCPVLILLGEKDKTGKVRQYCHQWHQNTGWPLVIIPNAAHLSNIDNPQAVNAAIAQFLEDI